MSVFPPILKRPWRVNHVPGAQPRVCLDPPGAYGEIVATVAGFTGHPDTEAVADAIAAVPDLIAFAMRVMVDHRAQLPSEAADLNGGGCGCPQCEEARRILKSMVILPEGGSK